MKLLLTIALAVASLISYSQDVQITTLVQIDGGGSIQILVEDYGSETYITIGGAEAVNVYDFSQKGQLLTYKMSAYGQKLGVMYFNLATDRFTISLADGTSRNGNILYKAQTI